MTTAPNHTLAWIAAYLVHRTGLLLLGFDGVVYWEEAFRLLAAEAVVGGWGLPWIELQADAYSGGSLVIALLSAPLVALFGPSLLVVKVVAMLWSALGLYFWMRVVERACDARTAALFALTWIAAPPIFSIYNLVAMGSHGEVVTLAGLIFFTAPTAFGCETARTFGRRVFVWGLVGGLSIWFSYTSAIVFAVSAAMVANAHRDLRLWVLRAAAGVAVGMLPWLVYNLAAGGDGLLVLGATFASPAAGPSVGPAAELAGLIRHGVPAALRFEALGPVSADLQAAVWLIAYAAALGLLVVRTVVGGAAAAAGAKPTWMLASIALVFPLFLLAIAASTQNFDPLAHRHNPVPFLPYRVIVPALPAVFAVLASAAADRRRSVAGAFIGIVVAIGICSTATVLRTGSTAMNETLTDARAVGAKALGHLLYYRHGPDAEVFNDRIALLPDELQAPAWQGIGFSLAFHHPADATPEELARVWESIDSEGRKPAREGMRNALTDGDFQVRPRLPGDDTRRLLATVDAMGS